MQQQRERANQLEQNLAAARRELETQTALRLKQAVDSGAVELRKSLQQERQRSEQLDQKSLTSAKRDLETQTALVAKVAESGATQLKRSLQQEHEKRRCGAAQVFAAGT